MYQLFVPSEKPQGRLILYFSGWGMTPVAVEHLQRPEGYDLLCLWYYAAGVEALDFDFSPYTELRVVAWSMGVWAADSFLALHPELRGRISSATAVAGTGYPMDDELGIPRAHYEAMRSELREDNRLRFDRRFCGAKSMRHLYTALHVRSTEELQAEHDAVYRWMLEGAHPTPKPEVLGLWTRAYIGAQDRILPPEHQLRYWQGQGLEPLLLTEEAHYLFGRFTSWAELWD